MKQQKEIPILLLEEIIRDGISITKYQESGDEGLLLKAAHRDDHYIFVLQLQGQSRIMVDFNEVELNGCFILCYLVRSIRGYRQIMSKHYLLPLRQH